MKRRGNLASIRDKFKKSNSTKQTTKFLLKASDFAKLGPVLNFKSNVELAQKAKHHLTVVKCVLIGHVSDRPYTYEARQSELQKKLSKM